MLTNLLILNMLKLTAFIGRCLSFLYILVSLVQEYATIHHQAKNSQILNTVLISPQNFDREPFPTILMKVLPIENSN